jgi:hypothetical protein
MKIESLIKSLEVKGRFMHARICSAEKFVKKCILSLAIYWKPTVTKTKEFNLEIHRQYNFTSCPCIIV